MNAAVIAGVTGEAWTFFGVIVTNAVILFGLFYRQGKQSRSVEQINRAVNHQGEDEPTLIQRVVKVEQRTEEIATETTRHRAWEHSVFEALAHHVGIALPQRLDHQNEVEAARRLRM